MTLWPLRLKCAALCCITGVGPVNAALLAAQILALSDAELAVKLKEYKRSLAESVAQGEASLQQELSGNA